MTESITSFNTFAAANQIATVFTEANRNVGVNYTPDPSVAATISLELTVWSLHKVRI